MVVEFALKKLIALVAKTLYSNQFILKLAFLVKRTVHSYKDVTNVKQNPNSFVKAVKILTAFINHIAVSNLY